MIRSGSLAARALLAIGLMLGFYALALAMAFGLFYIPYAEWVYAGRLDLRIGLFCVVAGVLILSSIVPKSMPFKAPGPQLKEADQPRLFERLRKLSQSVGQRMPGEVYLVSDLNAWVAEVERESGFGKRRVMGIGLPLLQVVTVSQFEAVLAHEFGHYHGGDTRLGPWIYKTRFAIAQTIQSLGAAATNNGLMSVIRAPFLWYGKLYLRITQAVSRSQELSADRLAAVTIGADSLADGLRAIHRAAAAASYYLNSEVFPAVTSGFSPPLTEGFASFLRSDSIVKSMDERLQMELSSPHVDPYDTHPPLAQRIAALQDLPKATASDNSGALSLIRNLPDVESQLMQSWLTDDTRTLRPIEWQEIGTAVLLPSWRKIASQAADSLAGVTLETLCGVAAKLDTFSRKLDVWTVGMPWEIVRQYASSVLGSALACALHKNGWTIENAPGVLWMVQGTNRLNPFQAVQRMTGGELTEEQWKEMMRSFGLDTSQSLVVTGSAKVEIAQGWEPKCDACGTPYNPADYRRDALRIFCTSCGAQLKRP